jgi:hypothetical protein
MVESQSDAGALSRPGMAVLALLGVATWALSHAYAGLFHDSGLYTLQALARLHPGSLSSDVFLKFGSQDRFTLFSPIYAATAHWLGVEPAAAALTLASQAALLAGAWVLARTVMPLPMAVLGLGLLIAVPGDYGSGRIFTCMESFLTPRMAAEALALAGLAAALQNSKRWAVLLMAGAALLHPIMAMAGIVALSWLYGGERRPAMALWAAAAVAALALGSSALPPGPLGRFDAEWLTWVKHRSPYLFLESWTIDDGSRAAVTLVTLLAGMRVLSQPARLLAKITLITGASGLAFTLVGCDLLHLAPVTQLQPWRWLWLGTVVSALLLPGIARTLWGMNRSGRATLLLLLSGWIFAATPYALAAAATALVPLTVGQRLRADEIRWVFLGSVGMLAIAVAWRLASNLEFTDSYYLDARIPGWLRRAMSFAHDGGAPAVLLASAWWMARRPARRLGLAALGVIAAAGCAVLVAPTWARWTERNYPPQRVAQFAVFRDLIPPGAEVAWLESPVAAWVLLDRPNYLSVLQTSGLVFSFQGARELQRRSAALGPAIDPATFMDWESARTGMTLSREQLRAACETGEFAFLVSAADLGMEPAATVHSNADSAGQIRLYRCPGGLHAAL